MDKLKQEDSPPNMKLFTDDREEAQVWEIRESGLGATAHVPGLPTCWPGWEDAAVPPDKVGAYLREFRKLLDDYDYQCSLYGHFGQGCIHCRISFDLVTFAGIEKYKRFINAAAELVVQYNGSISGEHGDGQARAALLEKMYGPELVQAFQEFKTIWDPEGQMNPGKVVDPFAPDENLRLGAAYNPRPLKTYFQFPDDRGSLADAILRCVGVGKCRRTHDAFMCPSFMATREEKDSTRGRARLLFEMVRQDVLQDGWHSKEVLDALELCLGCKGCKTDCPVNVDMATYKAEFLAHYYHLRPRPLQHYTMGLIGTWGALGAKMPHMANFFSRTAGFKQALKALTGVAAQRQLPQFTDQTFVEWFRARTPAKGQGEQILLYPDVFNNYFYPDSLRATVAILERWGFEVTLPNGSVSAIRPAIHYGFLALAKHQLKKAVAMLHPQVVKGVPVVFIEPSTAAVFREELPALWPHDHNVRRVVKSCYLLSEFIEKNQLPLPRLEAKAILHTHCHQQAALDAGASRRLLERIGLKIDEPQTGCCGMAGAFGFERKHYKISMHIAEQSLLPAVRQADNRTYILADGFSCRTQIRDGSSHEALHLAQFLEQVCAREDFVDNESG